MNAEVIKSLILHEEERKQLYVFGFTHFTRVRRDNFLPRDLNPDGQLVTFSFREYDYRGIVHFSYLLIDPLKAEYSLHRGKPNALAKQLIEFIERPSRNPWYATGGLIDESIDKRGGLCFVAYRTKPKEDWTRQRSPQL